jgi:cell division protein FtsL
VNKVIVVDKKNIINGSTALEPAQKPLRKKEKSEKYKKLNESKKEAQIRLREKQNREKIKILGHIACFFVIGMVIVGRYTIIYSNQKQIMDIKQDINTFKKNSDNLKIQLVKYNNINYIDKMAKEKLNMIEPNRADAEYCNLNENYFRMPEENPAEEKSFLTKIKELLF